MLIFYSFSALNLNNYKNEKSSWIGFSDEQFYDEWAS